MALSYYALQRGSNSKSLDKIPISVHSNWIYAVLSCTFYSIMYILYFGTLEKITSMIFFTENFTSKFPDCLVFFAVNFFQGLFWEFGIISRQYLPVAHPSCHCLVLIQSSFSRNKVSLLVLSYRDNSFFRLLSKLILYCFFMIMFKTVRRKF